MMMLAAAMWAFNGEATSGLWLFLVCSALLLGQAGLGFSLLFFFFSPATSALLLLLTAPSCASSDQLASRARSDLLAHLWSFVFSPAESSVSGLEDLLPPVCVHDELPAQQAGKEERHD